MSLALDYSDLCVFEAEAIKTAKLIATKSPVAVVGTK